MADRRGAEYYILSRKPESRTNLGTVCMDRIMRVENALRPPRRAGCKKDKLQSVGVDLGKFIGRRLGRDDIFVVLISALFVTHRNDTKTLAHNLSRLFGHRNVIAIAKSPGNEDHLAADFS